MNSKIKEYINQLRYFVLKGNSLDALQKIEDIENLLRNSVIIPKDKLQFEFTKIQEPCVRLDHRLGHMRCQILGPKEVYTYDMTNKFITENEEEFMKYVKEGLKKKLIDCWSMSKNDE